MVTLQAETRTKENKPAYIRSAGRVPAVFYGPTEKATPITVLKSDFIRVWKEAGESTVVSLTTEEGKYDVLIYNVDLHPVTNDPHHIDFYAIEKGKKVEVTVPLVFEGVSPAIKELGGSLVKVVHEIDVRALPASLPHEIVVSVEVLVDFESQITLKDIKLPEGVEVIGAPEEVVALVSEARDDSEEEVAPAIDLSQIEVEKKGKQEEEEDTEAPKEE